MPVSAAENVLAGAKAMILLSGIGAVAAGFQPIILLTGPVLVEGRDAVSGRGVAAVRAKPKTFDLDWLDAPSVGSVEIFD